MPETTEQFLDQTDLEHSLVIGYYGGGNFGDELLLEILQNKLSTKDYQDISIYYQNAANYAKYHHDFGFKTISGGPFAILGAMLKCKNIIIGGGGLWGLDTNAKVLVLSFLLFVQRYIFRKKVYLIGVGYYGSAGTLGRVSAWLAAKAATKIIARDQESTVKFEGLTPNVLQGRDMAWMLESLDLSSYGADLDKLEKHISVTQQTVFIALRHFRGTKGEKYLAAIDGYIMHNPDVPVIITIFESEQQYPEGYDLLRKWQKINEHVQTLTGAYNPMALVLFFKKYREKLCIIAPQFHIILASQIAGIRFLPLVYDNKVAELLAQLKISTPIPIEAITARDIEQLAYKTKEGEAR